MTLTLCDNYAALAWRGVWEKKVYFLCVRDSSPTSKSVDLSEWFEEFSLFAEYL